MWAQVAGNLWVLWFVGAIIVGALLQFRDERRLTRPTRQPRRSSKH